MIRMTGVEEAEKLLRGIPGAVPRATSRAINRSLTQTRSEGVRRVREEYHGKASDIRSTMRIVRSRPSDLYGAVESIGSPIRLTNFKVNPTRPLKRKRPVKVAVLKRGGGGTIQGAFVARMKNGFVGVFNRRTSKSYPIQLRYGPSAAQMLSRDSINVDVTDKMLEVFSRRMNHEVNNILRGITY